MNGIAATPKAKKNGKIQFVSPFPIPIGSSDIQFDNWPCYRGYAKGDSVIVKDSKEANCLKMMGFFGTELIDERKWRKRLSSDIRKCEEKNGRNSDAKSVEAALSDATGELDECRKRMEGEFVLELALEEAVFLCFALGCLVVSDSNGKSMTPSELFDYACAKMDKFIARYAVYHYLRSRGWVVKSGLQYGSDYLVYKKGPPFYHASFVAIAVDKDGGQSLSWMDVTTLQRVAAAAGKQVLICYVYGSGNVVGNNGKTRLDCLSSLKVEEVLFRRWIASEERESEDKSDVVLGSDDE